jgi:NAD(P)-dependent dehydrogenase (short-subunit alcohol dehydrogenase family)
MYLEKLKLDGRVAVVTGSGCAIGLACIQALAEENEPIEIVGESPAIADRARALAEGNDPRATCIHEAKASLPNSLTLPW